MISAIGFRPVIAAPMAAPRIACSEIGVSRTRIGPNCSSRPDRRLEHAAGAGDVLAEEHDVWSRSISCAMPRATASR